MPTKSPKPLPPRTKVALSHRIHTLLHTVRSIAHCEDELCTLLHASERSEVASVELSRDLKTLLTRMPANEYLDDIEALRAAVEISKPQRPAAAKQLSSRARQPARARITSGKAKPAPKKAAARRRRTS